MMWIYFYGGWLPENIVEPFFSHLSTLTFSFLLLAQIIAETLFFTFNASWFYQTAPQLANIVINL